MAAVSVSEPDVVRPAHGGRLRVPFVGRPNAGKSSLFGAVTGEEVTVGNFPGVTVDVQRASIALPGEIEAELVDLPGIYTLDHGADPDSDEAIACRFLEQMREEGIPSVVAQVVDATRLELGLRLTRLLLAEGLRVVLIVTQRDALEAEGKAIDAGVLEHAIGGQVCVVSVFDRDVRERVLAAIGQAAASPPPKASTTRTFDPRELARTACRASSHAGARRSATSTIDAWLMHPVFGPAAFVAIMTSIFGAVLVVAEPVTSVLELASTAIADVLRPALGGGKLASFFVDGALGGASTVLAFLPQIVVLTVALEILQASGYLARGAFLLHRALGFLGLSGRAFVPLLMGHACAVPAIAATRILRDPRERLLTILLLPLMTCSARLPTYALVVGTFFVSAGVLGRALIFVGLYVFSLVVASIAGAGVRRVARVERALPLVLELPGYRMPRWGWIAKKAWQTAVRFTKEVGTTIVVVSMVLWALLSVPAPWLDSGAEAAVATTSAEALTLQTSDGDDDATDAARAQADISSSVAAGVGRAVEPLTRPLGFDWRINVSLIAAFGARELAVGTLGVIFGMENADEDPEALAPRLRAARSPNGDPAYGIPMAVAYLIFFAVACQCMSTIAAIRRETRSWRWPALVVAYTYVLAFSLAFVGKTIAAWIVGA